MLFPGIAKNILKENSYMLGSQFLRSFQACQVIKIRCQVPSLKSSKSLQWFNSTFCHVNFFFASRDYFLLHATNVLSVTRQSAPIGRRKLSQTWIQYFTLKFLFFYL